MSNMADSLAKQRIAKLLDENSFVEIGAMITARSTDFNLKGIDTPSDGVVTGYGLIDGNLVYVYSQDPAVLSGTVGEMHARKISAVYDMAMKMGAPVIGLIDCAGIRLQEATDALNGFGGIYMKQTLASGVIPQISCIFGTCGGGLAMVPALSDFTYMESTKGKLFVNSPNAIAGNEITKCNTSSAKFQSESTGLVDGIGTEETILGQIRQLITLLPSSNEENDSYEDCVDDLNRACEGLENCVGDTRILLSMISDENLFVETKADYAKDMVTGFVRLNGMTVGAIANCTEIHDADGTITETFESVLSVRGSYKAAEFASFCDAFQIPILTITNTTGFRADNVCSEKNMAKAVSKLMHNFASATVPKVNLIVGTAYGSAYLAMNSKSIGADLVYAWPTAKIGMMDEALAAKIMYADETKEVMNEKAKEYAQIQSNVLSAARRGYVDTIIEAVDTRKYVIGAFEMLFTKKEDRPVKKHGAK